MWIWSLGKSRRSRSRVWQTFLPPCGLCQGKLYLGELHLHLWSNAQLVAELPFSELCPPFWMTSVISALWTLSIFLNDLCYLCTLNFVHLSEWPLLSLHSELCPPFWMISVISALWTLSTFLNDLCYLRILSRLQLIEILYYFLMMLHNYRDYPGNCVWWQFMLYVSITDLVAIKFVHYLKIMILTLVSLRINIDLNWKDKVLDSVNISKPWLIF